MTGIVLLDVAIGVFFALMVYSLAATTIQEAIASLLNLRGKKLREGIYRLVSDELGPKVMGKAPIKALYGPGSLLSRDQIGNSEEKGRLPSTIPPASFAKALMLTLLREYSKLKARESGADKALAAMKDKVAKIEIDQGLRDNLLKYLDRADKAEGVLGTVDDALERVRDRVGALGLSKANAAKVTTVLNRIDKASDSVRESVPVALESLRDMLGTSSLEDGLKAHLTGVISHVEAGINAARAELVTTVEKLETEIAGRFDTAMDRVVGWYVRQTKVALFAIGLALAALTNFNVIGYAGDLVSNDELRAKIVAQAEVIAKTSDLVDAKSALFGPDAAGDAAKPETLEAAATQLQGAAMQSLESLNNQLGDRGVELGWVCKPDDPECTSPLDRLSLAGVMSWVLIAFACTMGGQFWYDALKKLMSVRAMAVPAPAAEEKRQTDKAGAAS